MNKKKKPRAYLEKWGFQFEGKKWVMWYARDNVGNTIANSETKKECEKICRANGYVPERKW